MAQDNGTTVAAEPLGSPAKAAKAYAKDHAQDTLHVDGNSNGKRVADSEAAENGQDDENAVNGAGHTAKKTKNFADDAAVTSASATEPAPKVNLPADKDAGKGKGKSADAVEDVSEEELDEQENGDEEEEEEGNENDDVEEEEVDDLAEIDTGNIVQGGRRTRGLVIDFAKADADHPAEAAEEDEDEDEDYHANTTHEE